MGVLDKIKNALFEVEYVEVEEPPKVEKKKKNKIKEKKDNKPIAKKVVLPGKREDRIQELEEEELKDEDFEIKPRREVVVEPPKEEFKFMDDKDFQMEDDFIPEEPEIVSVIEEDEKEEKTREEEVKEVINREIPEKKEVVQEKHYDYYDSGRKENTSIKNESKPYGVDTTYRVPVHEYGAYEKKEEKVYFQPSPIISPIYGILDRNYRKEDVKEKKEVRITTNYSRSNVSVDDIRNKAYGHRGKEEKEIDVDNQFEVEEDDDNLLVDLSDRAKPEVKELTMGDAMEYFQDLGLEYNVDYVDVSKEKKPEKKKETRVSRNQNVEEAIKEEKTNTQKEEVKQEKKNIRKDNNKATVDLDSNDNLFDLIDSMYQESD